MADAAALVRAASNSTKLASALRNQWDVRTKTKAAINDGAAMSMVIRAQIDEVFLVLAHLGEAILPLGIFNKDYYLQTLGEVQASIASCSEEMNELLTMAWAELDAELQYVCTAGFTICACYSPMPVYRGFGACVLGDWDWACPDMKHLEEKARKKAIRTIYGFKQKVDPQPTKSVFVAFDQVIQILQVKAMAFLEKRPILSSFSDHQPRFGPKPKKEAKDDLSLFEDWIKQMERRGHPTPKGSRLTSWGIPFATWTSQYSCHVLKTEKDCETIMCNQMDPGRLLHAFVCRGGLNLEEGQVLLLPPRSPAESLTCWLEGLPGTSHKTVKWEDLDTEYFETKLSKSLKKKIGRYPLPTQYAVRDPQASSRPGLPHSSSSRAILEHPNTVSPPPYSPITKNSSSDRPRSAAELGHPDPGELPASAVPTSQPRSAQHSASLPVPGTGSTGLKSIHNLRRKTTGGTSTADTTRPMSQPTAVEMSAEQPDVQTQAAGPSTAVELHEDTAPTKSSETASPTAVELPTDFQSEAPKGLSTKSTTTAGLPQDKESTPLDKHLQTTDNISESVVVSEEPKSVVDATAKGNDLENNTDVSGPISGNQYLELLNKVAKGEISPQALSEMLATGTLTASNTQSTDAATVTEGELSKTGSGPSASGSVELSHPLSATERENNESDEQNKPATGASYPSSTTEQNLDVKPTTSETKHDTLASLRPGA